jgi:hypothetical protein
LGQTNVDHEMSHGGFGYGSSDDAGEKQLGVAAAYEPILANTHFKKKEHLICLSHTGVVEQLHKRTFGFAAML